MHPNIWPRVYVCPICGERSNGLCLREACTRAVGKKQVTKNKRTAVRELKAELRGES